MQLALQAVRAAGSELVTRSSNGSHPSWYDYNNAEGAHISRKFTSEGREQPGSNGVLLFSRRPDIPRPAPDLSDMDRMHENVASGRLADVFTDIISRQRGR